MSLNFDHNSNLSREKVSHYEKIVKMCQFYSDSSHFFNQLYNRIAKKKTGTITATEFWPSLVIPLRCKVALKYS
jgi:hypothetical protein